MAKSNNKNVFKGIKPHVKETVMSEDGKSQSGPLSCLSVTSFQFNLDLGNFLSPQCMFILILQLE